MCLASFTIYHENTHSMTLLDQLYTSLASFTIYHISMVTLCCFIQNVNSLVDSLLFHSECEFSV